MKKIKVKHKTYEKIKKALEIVFLLAIFTGLFVVSTIDNFSMTFKQGTPILIAVGLVSIICACALHDES